MEFMPKFVKVPDSESSVKVMSVTLPEFKQDETLSQSVLVLGLNHPEFVEPVKRVSDVPSLNKWLDSPAIKRLLIFIQKLNASVMNKKLGDLMDVSEPIRKTKDLLKTLDSWIDEIPPLESPQRFGNRAFATWLERLETQGNDLLCEMLEPSLHASIPELSPYLKGGFGNGTRIDYGSGHELSFVAWLCCLNLIGFYRDSDSSALVLEVFQKYLVLVRRLQQVYMLEPAGSHGVWGLDDFQFLSYFWGSAQLLDHKKIKPKSIMQQEIVEYFSKDYIYLACIKYINDVKKGPFFEHSPMLYDISGVPLWSKVNSGLLKMYVAEVLSKVPIIQHFLFGSLLPFDDMKNTPNT